METKMQRNNFNNLLPNEPMNEEESKIQFRPSSSSLYHQQNENEVEDYEDGAGEGCEEDIWSSCPYTQLFHNWTDIFTLSPFAHQFESCTLCENLPPFKQGDKVNMVTLDWAQGLMIITNNNQDYFYNLVIGAVPSVEGDETEPGPDDGPREEEQ